MPTKADAFASTLLMSLVWLVLLATVMAECLDAIGMHPWTELGTSKTKTLTSAAAAAALLLTSRV